MRELGRRRGFERDGAAALGVDTGENLADDTVLARGIEALEHQEEAALPLGVEPLLQDAQPLDELFPLLLGARLVVAEGLARVARRQFRAKAGLNTELLDQGQRTLLPAWKEVEQVEELGDRDAVGEAA